MNQNKRVLSSIGNPVVFLDIMKLRHQHDNVLCHTKQPRATSRIFDNRLVVAMGLVIICVIDLTNVTYGTVTFTT